MMAPALRGAALIGAKEEVLRILQKARFTRDTLSCVLQETLMGKRKEHTEITQILLDNGGVDEIYEERRTPLHLAALGGNAQTVALLLKRGVCDPNARDSKGCTALQLAIGLSAAEHQHEATQILLQEEAVDVNTVDAPRWTLLSKRTPLYYASSANCVSCAEELLKRGAQVDGSSVSPLIAAAEKNNCDILRFLLHNGADINKKERYGDTALTSAVKKCHKQAIEYLLQNGANITLTGADRCSAWDLALRRNEKEIQQILLQYMDAR